MLRIFLLLVSVNLALPSKCFGRTEPKPFCTENLLKNIAGTTIATRSRTYISGDFLDVVAGIMNPSGDIPGCPWIPNAFGIDGPVISASSTATECPA